MYLTDSEYEKRKTLNPNGFWGIWCRLSLGEQARDYCSLFLNSIFSFITLPLWIFPGFIINCIWKDTGTRYWYYCALNIFLVIIGMIFMAVLGETEYSFSSNWIYLLHTYLWGSLVMVCLLIIGGLIYLTLVWSDSWKTKTKKTSVIETYFHDLKKKHCSLIVWEKEEEKSNNTDTK